MPDLNCNKCTKGLPLTFKCKCGHQVCIKHRFEHECTFDHKNISREQLAKNNPTVVKEKIVKI